MLLVHLFSLRQLRGRYGLFASTEPAQAALFGLVLPRRARASLRRRHRPSPSACIGVMLISVARAAVSLAQHRRRDSSAAPR
jgi:threonine/homoserine efflux transporter RhtA